MALIGLVDFGVVGAFAACAGWIGPRKLTPAALIDLAQKTDGGHVGFRRLHAKGVCVVGTFESNGEGARFSRAAALKAGSSPVVGRFALAPGNAYLADNEQVARSLGIEITPASGEIWRSPMLGLPFFPVKTPAAFYDQNVAMLPDPKTGKPDPEKVKTFAADHPEFLNFVEYAKTHPHAPTFAGETFTSIHAYYFVAETGVRTPVRWALKPLDPPGAAPDAAQSQDANFLFNELIARMRKGPVKYQFVATLAGAGDPLDDPSVLWPADRQQIVLGAIVFDHIETEAAGNCRDINYDPLVVPDGVKPSADPFLSARSAAYSISYQRRAGENKEPSAVQVPIAEQH